MKTFLFNPYTGRPRDPRDIQSDPEGILIVEPEAPLRAEPTQTKPLVVSESMSDEYFLAIRNTHQKNGADKYFGHYPTQENPIYRAIFNAGFCAGYDTPNSEPTAPVRVPLTRPAIDALYEKVEAEVAQLELERRYTFAGWFPVAVR